MLRTAFIEALVVEHVERHSFVVIAFVMQNVVQFFFFFFNILFSTDKFLKVISWPTHFYTGNLYVRHCLMHLMI